MSYPVPEFSKEKVNKAGRILVSEDLTHDEYNWAQGVLENWRACHGYPINTFQATLRDKLERLGMSGHIVAQRLKRTPSILSKLKRQGNMNLARMHDIGGLRAVVKNISEVRKLESDYRRKFSGFQHKIKDVYDYINEPKADGYRSIHLVFKYENKRAPDKYSGLLLELQIRTKLQHVWATAVETMGAILNQSLKSQEGEKEWLDFFEVAGEAFARLEKSPSVPGYENLSAQDVFRKVAKLEKSLKAIRKLNGYKDAIGGITDKEFKKKFKGYYHLIILDLNENQIFVRPFAKTSLDKATKAYTEEESFNQNRNIVLVSAGSLNSLKRAYPNYFLDTSAFIKKIEEIIKKAN